MASFKRLIGERLVRIVRVRTEGRDKGQYSCCGYDWKRRVVAMVGIELDGTSGALTQVYIQIPPLEVDVKSIQQTFFEVFMPVSLLGTWEEK